MARRLLIPALFLIAWTSVGAAFGCEGKQVIFEDQFTDNSGGWTLVPPFARVEHGALIIDPPPQKMQKTLNVTFGVRDADICAEVVLPQNDSKVGAGLAFWSKDAQNLFGLQIKGDGGVGIWRLEDGKWLAIRGDTPDIAVKKNPGATNTLRATVKGGLVSLYVNGAKIQDIRAQAPQRDWYFGLYGMNSTDGPVSITFKKVKVTSAE
jgi:hypothetical protein